MTPERTIELATALLKRVGVSGWTVSIVDDINVDSDVPVEWRFGVAIFSKKLIQFQRAAVIRESDAAVRELISHEVCHAWWGNTVEDHSPDFLVEAKAFQRLLDKMTYAAAGQALPSASDEYVLRSA